MPASVGRETNSAKPDHTEKTTQWAPRSNQTPYWNGILRKLRSYHSTRAMICFICNVVALLLFTSTTAYADAGTISGLPAVPLDPDTANTIQVAINDIGLHDAITAARLQGMLDSGAIINSEALLKMKLNGLHDGDTIAVVCSSLKANPAIAIYVLLHEDSHVTHAQPAGQEGGKDTRTATGTYPGTPEEKDKATEKAHAEIQEYAMDLLCAISCTSAFPIGCKDIKEGYDIARDHYLKAGDDAGYTRVSQKMLNIGTECCCVPGATPKLPL